MHFVIKVIFSFCILINVSYAKVVSYHLTINYQTVGFDGKSAQGMTVNSSIPAPTLYFKEGETAEILVTNAMDVDTSIHWHGILLPNHQDGVPYVNHPPIEPGESHLFTFKIRQSGTYWYHSHTGLQEQRGIYGAIVISPNNERPLHFDKEATVVLSDWTHENPDEVLRTLKSGSDYYSIKKGSKQNILSAIQNNGVGYLFQQSLTRMPGMDLSDVAYDQFLANGKPETFIPAEPGKILKLRLVNAATASYFTLQYAQGDMEIIAADGIDVEPIKVNNFLMAIAETYTLLLKVPEQGAYELRATAQDGSGYSSIWVGKGDKTTAPERIKPNPYQMSMPMDTKHDHDGKKMSHHGHEKHQFMDHQKHTMNTALKHEMSAMSQTPYPHLKAVSQTILPADNKLREIQLNLTGDMERYVWSINNEILSEDNVIKIKRGENIRFVLNNKTMMHHPMHLHGHFFRVLNGQGNFSPLKHTVDVPPMGQRIIEFEANEEDDWFFHCHILYHAKSGMARIISYQDDTIDQEIESIRHNLYKDEGFFYSSGSFLSHMTEGQAVFSNSKNSLQTDWEVGWQNVPATEYEVNLRYQRYVNRFFSGFVGVTFEDKTERGIFGFNYLLPLNFETEWRVDTAGELRVTIDKKLQLSNHITLLAEFEYDTKTEEKWSTGIHYQVSKNLGFVAQYHSKFGLGGGIRLAF